MTDDAPQSLLELARYCEGGNVPNRALDWAIHCRDGLSGVGAYGDHPAYTDSLDAAVTLVGPVEQPFVWTVLTDFGGLCRARVSDSIRVQVEADAATPALALCAASLRARAASEQATIDEAVNKISALYPPQS